MQIVEFGKFLCWFLVLVEKILCAEHFTLRDNFYDNIHLLGELSTATQLIKLMKIFIQQFNFPWKLLLSFYCTENDSTRIWNGKQCSPVARKNLIRDSR